MSTEVENNGASPASSGQIFHGLEFWVSQRVPMRPGILDRIRNHGGEVVPLEKDADYLIADHARKDAPSGSLSWKFITDSVENGIVQLPDRYRIGKNPVVVPKTGMRTKFTQKDDAALLRWVLTYEGDRKGNCIYQDFAAKNPRHPWQSWRHRYISKLMDLPEKSQQQLMEKSGDAVQMPNEGQQENDCPDPIELMQQRKGERIRKEHEAQRATEREKYREGELAILPPPSPPSAQMPRERQASPTGDPNESAQKRLFYEDLQLYAEQCGIYTAPTQQVAGQTVELWELSKAVSRQELPADEIDWTRVAKDLGYARPDVDDASHALQRCFQQKLAEFLELMDDISGIQSEGVEEGDPVGELGGMEEREAEEDEEEEEEKEEEEAFQTARVGQVLSKAQLPPLQPERFLSKKQHLDADDDDDDDDDFYSVMDFPPSAKRRRIIRSEIPDSPKANRHCQPESNTSKRLIVPPTPAWLQSRVAAASRSDKEPVATAAREGPVGSPSLCSPAESPRQSSTGVKRRALPASGAYTRPKPAATTTATTAAAVTIAAAAAAAQARRDEEEEDDMPIFIFDDEPWDDHGSDHGTANDDRDGGGGRDGYGDSLAELIQRFVALGHARRVVVEALRRTTVTPGLAKVVMRSLEDGRGVPPRHEGIWTDSDDENLRMLGDADSSRGRGWDRDLDRRKRRQRLRIKHGEERMASRLEFLAAMETACRAGDVD